MERNLLIIMHQSASSYKENMRHPVNAGLIIVDARNGSLPFPVEHQDTPPSTDGQGSDGKLRIAPNYLVPKNQPSTDIPGNTRNEIDLIKEGGTYKVPVTINGALTLNFTVDSGATDVVLPADVVLVLKRTGTLSDNDFLGTQTYVLADGTKVPSKTFRIRKLQLGNRTLQDVTGSMGNVEGALLLGQSFLSRFHSVSFDYEKQKLILE
jgi:predicted aspartyl protease